MWHFLKLVARGFLRVPRFPPLLHWFNDSANKISSNKCNFNSVKLNSWAVPSYQVACNMTLARDQRSMCCTRFAHDCAWATWACMLETVRGAVRRLQKISNSTFECDYYYYYYYQHLFQDCTLHKAIKEINMIKGRYPEGPTQRQPWGCREQQLLIKRWMSPPPPPPPPHLLFDKEAEVDPTF